MAWSKYLLSSFFIFSFSASTAQTTDTAQLEKQMKCINHRLKIYAKCLRGNGTKEECTLAGKAAIKDAAIAVASLAVLGTGIAAINVYRKGNWPFTSEARRKQYLEKQIEYLREQTGRFEKIDDALKAEYTRLMQKQGTNPEEISQETVQNAYQKWMAYKEFTETQKKLEALKAEFDKLK